MHQPLIAVVDDEQDLLDNFKLLLEDQYRVQTFSSPAEFLRNLPDLQANGLRLLISDYKMPGMTGLEMIQKALSQVETLPFIILSGFLDKKTVIAAVDMGVFRLLEKPCPPNAILEAIDQLLVEAELRDVRNEIRQITSQLRELYSTVRIALLQYIPEDVMDRLVLDTQSPDDNGTLRKMSFDQLLENLESRLEQLLASERMMNQIRDSRLQPTGTGN